MIKKQLIYERLKQKGYEKIKKVKGKLKVK
jgi:hypothetical protein